MQTKEEIEQILAVRLSTTCAALENARKHFGEVTSDIHPGIRVAERALRIQNAGNQYRAALNAYAKAFYERNEFMARGIIPLDIKKTA